MDGLTRSIGLLLFPAEQTAYEQNVAAAKEMLGAEAFEEAWPQGQGLTLDQAVESALAQAE